MTTARKVGDRYARFRERIVGGDPVAVTVGPGGLSFYVTTSGTRRFVCHFNAEPRRGETDRGFADFKPARTGLDPDDIVARLESRLSARAECRRGQAWWSAHFAASDDDAVASAFRQVVDEPVLAGTVAPRG